MAHQPDSRHQGDSSPGLERVLRRDVPGFSGAAVSAGIGGFWGLVGYTILWEGVPAQVDRAFVDSIVGLILLLPVRLVIWSIHVAEEFAGRSFDLSRTYLWIGFAASALGAAIACVAFLLARGLMARARSAGLPRPRRR